MISTNWSQLGKQLYINNNLVSYKKETSLINYFWLFDKICIKYLKYGPFNISSSIIKKRIKETYSTQQPQHSSQNRIKYTDDEKLPSVLAYGALFIQQRIVDWPHPSRISRLTPLHTHLDLCLCRRRSAVSGNWPRCRLGLLIGPERSRCST